jgi:hypothetical protein
MTKRSTKLNDAEKHKLFIALETKVRNLRDFTRFPYRLYFYDEEAVFVFQNIDNHLTINFTDLIKLEREIEIKYQDWSNVLFNGALNKKVCKNCRDTNGRKKDISKIKLCKVWNSEDNKRWAAGYVCCPHFKDADKDAEVFKRKIKNPYLKGCPYKLEHIVSN